MRRVMSSASGGWRSVMTRLYPAHVTWRAGRDGSLRRSDRRAAGWVQPYPRSTTARSDGLGGWHGAGAPSSVAPAPSPIRSPTSRALRAELGHQLVQLGERLGH